VTHLGCERPIWPFRRGRPGFGSLSKVLLSIAALVIGAACTRSMLLASLMCIRHLGPLAVPVGAEGGVPGRCHCRALRAARSQVVGGRRPCVCVASINASLRSRCSVRTSNVECRSSLMTNLLR
jgi:hypothetical protein